MVGLNGSLSIAERALSAQYAGLAVTNNNIANANTVGYTREVVNLSSQAYVQNGTPVGEGVSYEGYTSVRDNVLQLAINTRTSQQSGLTAQSTALASVNTAFSGTDTGVGAAMNTWFSSISALSSSPNDASGRQAMLDAGNALVSAFHQAAGDLTAASTSANQQVTDTVARINDLTSQIASLNGQLAQVQASGQDGGALEDQRDALTTQLAGLTGISNTGTETTPTLTTVGGTPLVIGSKAFTLQVATGTRGQATVLDANGVDVTTQLTGSSLGTLGGALTVRDQTLPGLSLQLDTLATQFADAITGAQNAGYTGNGEDRGGVFGLPANAVSGTSVTGAAAGISLYLTSGSQLALSANGAAGDSGNVANFLAVQNNKLPMGATPTDAYASLVSSAGSAAATVSSQLTATTASLSQLTTQRDSTSGVSIDEESTNLIRYQQAYTAAAKVISTLSDLYNTVMNMSSGS